MCYFNVYMWGQVGSNWGQHCLPKSYAKLVNIYLLKVKVCIRSKFTWGHFYAKLKVILFTSWVKGHDLSSLHVGWQYEDYWLSIKCYYQECDFGLFIYWRGGSSRTSRTSNAPVVICRIEYWTIC